MSKARVGTKKPTKESFAAQANSLTKKTPYKGPGADSEEKHEPVSDIDTAAVDSLKALDPKRPIREADMVAASLSGVTSGMRVRRDQLQYVRPVLVWWQFDALYCV